jgi:hypothetical protein
MQQRKCNNIKRIYLPLRLGANYATDGSIHIVSGMKLMCCTVVALPLGQYRGAYRCSCWHSFIAAAGRSSR